MNGFIKNTVRIFSFALVCMFITLFAACTGCGEKDPWNYENTVWYSNDPKIEIMRTENVFWIGYIMVGDETVQIKMIWGHSYYFRIVYADYDVISDETTLLRGAVDFDSNSATLNIEKDNVFNNQYSEIVLYRRPLENPAPTE